MNEEKYKICATCKIEKQLEKFHKCKKNKDGLNYSCKDCRNKKQKEYCSKEEVKIKKAEYAKIYNEINKEEISKKRKRYREENKEKLLEYRKNNKENKAIYDKAYREKNKEKRIKQNKNYIYAKRENDVCFKLRERISSFIKGMLKSQNSNKNGKSILDFLPYTIQQLKEHLESQFEDWMTWKNHGVYKINGSRKWHIDHIIPQSKLLYDSMRHPNFKKCWALENLRPLEAIENIKKGNRK